MIMLHLILAVALLGDPPPSPNLYQSLESSHSHAAGVIRGEIDSVDYSGGAIVVGGKRIAVVPNTTIYNGNDYAALSDLRKGQKVEVAVYEVDGKLVAQSIRLK